MSVALRKPRMTRKEYFAWAEAQDARYEFDGFQPVAMTGGSPRHNLIALSIHRALHARLRDGPSRPYGMDAGLATVGDTIRYPDAMVSCAKLDRNARTVSGAVVVFEVLSPGSGRMDRIVKPVEYSAVPSILRYVILELDSADLTNLVRAVGMDAWTSTPLTADDVLHMPEIGIAIPVAEFYADVDLPGMDQPGGAGQG